ncbi:hypothetical protein [Streptomyces subrutilus]|uniref:MmyB family transcriptional regulator n=1 Tax=Streptomyces subrutilus TaxID=36818 RepID=UPI003990C8E4
MASRVRALLADSPEFAAPWQDHSVSGLGRKAEVLNHPDAGRIILSYQAFNAQAASGRHSWSAPPSPRVPALIPWRLRGPFTPPPTAGGATRRRPCAPSSRPTLMHQIPSERPGPVRGRGGGCSDGRAHDPD